MVMMRSPKSFVKDCTSKRFYRKFDYIDNDIFRLSKATLLNYIMTPFIGAVDTFWISKLGNPEIIAGEGSADRLFSSIYHISSFAPSVITPIISKYHANNNDDNISVFATTSAFLVSGIGLLMTCIMVFNTKFFLNKIIPETATSYVYASQYLQLRSTTFCIALLNSLAFAIMRGKKDLKTPMRINIISQIVNGLLDPILMKFMGVRGVALGTVVAELVAFYLFYSKLFSEKIFKISNFDLTRIPSLIKRGFSVQTRSICISLVGLVGLKRIQSIDVSNTLVAAHILNNQLFEFGYIVSNSLGHVGAILIPRYKDTSIVENKLYFWGALSALTVMFGHLLIGNLIYVFTDNPGVVHAAKQVIPVAALYQLSCGFTSITEGMIQGHAKYRSLSVASCLSLVSYATMLPFTNTLPQIWTAMCLSNSVRFLFNFYSLKFGHESRTTKNDT